MRPAGPHPRSLARFDSTQEAWDFRVQMGQRGAQMGGAMSRFGRERTLCMFADWTDRIAAGEYPTDAPPRPRGVERNIVMTMWDWGTDRDYIHDEIATDKRNPTLNANGPVYGVAFSGDTLTITDPAAHTGGLEGARLVGDDGHRGAVAPRGRQGRGPH